jgi:hypothetical protein
MTACATGDTHGGKRKKNGGAAAKEPPHRVKSRCAAKPAPSQSNFRNAGNAGTVELIARCQPGYFFLPSLSVLLIFLPPPDRVQDGPGDAGQIGRGTQDFKNQIHRPLQSEIEALPADGFRGGQDSTPRAAVGDVRPIRQAAWVVTVALATLTSANKRGFPVRKTPFSAIKTRCIIAAGRYAQTHIYVYTHFYLRK